MTQKNAGRFNCCNNSTYCNSGSDRSNNSTDCNSGSNRGWQQHRLQQRKLTEATTAPTATAEATEATTAPTEAPTATVDPSWDGSVDISENFDGESAVDGNGYKWDVVIGNDWGGTNKALSLTANDGKSILKVPNGMGSKTKRC